MILRLSLLATLVLLAGLLAYRHGTQQEPHFRDLDQCEEWLRRRVTTSLADLRRKRPAPNDPWAGAVMMPPRTPGSNEFYISWYADGTLTSFTILSLDSSSLRHGQPMPRWGNVVYTIPPGHPLLKAIQRAWREGGKI